MSLPLFLIVILTPIYIERFLCIGVSTKAEAWKQYVRFTRI